MLRFHLPPNLAASIVRDAVPVKVELDPVAPPAELLPALALLQRWLGPAAGAPPYFLQLTRAQMRELTAAIGDRPVFVEKGQPTPWRFAQLLGEPKPAIIPIETGPAKVASRATSHTTSPLPRRIKSANASPLLIDGSEHFLALTLPSREHPLYARALELVKENGFTLEPANRKWWLRDRHKVLNFLAGHLDRFRTTFDSEFTPNFEKNIARIHTAEIATQIDDDGAEFAVTIGVKAGSADEATLRAAVSTNRGYLESEGKIFLLDSAQLQKLATAQRALSGDPTAGLAPRRTLRLSSARSAEAEDILAELSPNFAAPSAWRERSAALRDLTALSPAPIPAELDRQLRPYQRLGVAWLWHLRRHDLAGILADEMGLGKTLQALGLLSAVHAHAQGKLKDQAPSLVVAPASLLENWRRESARFAPALRTFVHHADRRLASVGDFAGYDLVITSYGTLTRDLTLFSDVKFACVIADEAQHIKNRRSQNAIALRSLQARTRYLLTGTPLENSLDDLRSLFEFLLPGYLTRVPTGVRGEERVWYDQRLRAQTAPYILRRTKQVVAPELPAKLEQVIWCEMSAAQATLYRQTQETSERELIDLEAGGASEAKLKFAALTQLLRLRQICCDPRLVKNATAANAQTASAKLDALNELLAEALDDGHRVLVFSQFTSLLGLLRTELTDQSLLHCYLDGSMPTRARQAEVDRFQENPDIPLFLLSLKAGGTGLNLTGADTVVHFDPWWNPAAEAQATDRAHRIGQTRVVTSYKLICAGTVEEKVLALQEEKRALLADIFEASDAAAAKLSLTDLKSLLHA